MEASSQVHRVFYGQCLALPSVLALFIKDLRGVASSSGYPGFKYTLRLDIPECDTDNPGGQLPDPSSYT